MEYFVTERKFMANKFIVKHFKENLMVNLFTTQPRALEETKISKPYDV